MSANILIISMEQFPYESAGSLRILNFCKLLKEEKYNPIVLCRNKDNKSGLFEGIMYKSIYSTNRFVKLLKYVFYHIYIRRELQQYPNISTVMIVDAPILTWMFLKRFCGKRNISIIHDCVEWYSPEQFNHPKLNYFYLKKNIINYKIIDKQINVISISEYLFSYFKKKGIHTIRIPVILDFIHLEKEVPHEKTIFIYAGSPGKKDYLDIILKSITQLNKSFLKSIEIHLYGVKNEDIKKLVSEEEYLILLDCIKCYGKVPHNQVLVALSKCHYSLLFRDSSLRYAKAGFPTKVAESMMSSVPVVTNLSSDLHLYLKDEKNAIVAANDTINSYVSALERAILLSQTPRYIEISNNACLLARRYFYYSNYKDKFMFFLKESEQN